MLIHRNIKILFCLLSLALVNPANAVLTKYTDEATYLADLAAASYDTAHESFETGTWTSVRAFTSAPSVMNLGMTWAPVAAAGPSAGMTSSNGDFHDGAYEMFTLDGISHANPDGYTLSAPFTLYAVGGWFRSNDSAKLSFTLDGAQVVDFTGEEATVGAYKFLGFIETAGFNSLEIRTSDEVGNETRTFWSDDFNIGAQADAFLDGDGDGVPDLVDNCPINANADQLDTDGDSQGDVCDTDDDGDTILDTSDNCPLTANTDQANNDGDSLGDVCDTDDDNDTVLDTTDNCPLDANTNQADNDNDGTGDVCDSDDDNDTILDGVDNCPLNANTNQADNDNDGTGDVCDADDDNDTILDIDDNCPLISNTDQADADGDGIGDVCDPLTDSDEDGISDSLDLCPGTPFGEPVDANGCSLSQLDSDGDGVNDAIDNCPVNANTNQADLDNDGQGDVCDTDDDGDGVADGVDNCPINANPTQTDTDGDGQGDICDSDDDGDGVADDVDNCPLNANPGQIDTDGDGIGDVCDPLTDTDGDGIGDTVDNCPMVSNSGQTDTDNDGQGDACDVDDDNDGMPDSYEDSYPFLDRLNPSDAFLDEDQDGQTNLEEYLSGRNPGVYDPVSLVKRPLLTLTDQNGNGSTEVAMLGRRDNGNLQVLIYDSLSGSQLRSISLPAETLPYDFVLMDDINGNNFEEIVILVRDSNGYLLSYIYDSFTAKWINTLVFPTALMPNGIVVVPDINNNGFPEVLAVGRLTGSGYLIGASYDSNTRNWVNTIVLPTDLNIEAIDLLSDTNSNGFDELIVMGRRDTGGYLMSITYDTFSASWLNTIVLPTALTPLTADVVPSINGDASPELMVTGVLDGFQQVFFYDTINSTHVKTVVLPTDLVIDDVQLTGDTNGNIRPDVLALGRSAGGFLLGILYDTNTGTWIRTIVLPTDIAPDGMVMLPDTNNNGYSELGILGLRSSTGFRIVAMYDSQSGNWVNTFAVPSDFKQ